MTRKRKNAFILPKWKCWTFIAGCGTKAVIAIQHIKWDKGSVKLHVAYYCICLLQTGVFPDHTISVSHHKVALLPGLCPLRSPCHSPWWGLVCPFISCKSHNVHTVLYVHTHIVHKQTFMNIICIFLQEGEVSRKDLSCRCDLNVFFLIAEEQLKRFSASQARLDWE